MTVEPRRREMQQIVARTFLDLGVQPRAIFELKETALVDGGTCMARCFRVEDLKAVWCVDDEIVNFFDAQGHLLRTVNLTENVVPQVA